MTTIRSAPPPLIPPRPASDARAAFFKAIGTPQAPASPTAAPPQAVVRQAASEAAPRPAATAPTQPAGQERPFLRPGSIIDIKV